MPASDEQLATDLIDAANAVYGAHPGRRALHARGCGLAGRFTASGGAAGLTIAAHLVEGTVPVLARFSGGTGDPDAPDRTHMSHGLAVRFQTASGNHDLLAVDSPVFLTQTPELFLEFLQLSAPDPATGRPDQERLLAWLAEHPVTAANAAARQSAPLPASYGDLTYHAVHAFELIGPDQANSFVRFRWIPPAPGAGLDDVQAAERPPTFLTDELDARLSVGQPVVFDLMAQLADDLDDPADPATAWPNERTTVSIGRLELVGRADTEGKIFDPSHVVDGVRCGPDPVLAARPAAYSVSYERRTTG
jgi:catalase